MFEPESVRRDFPILRRQIRGKSLVYLDNAATTQKPAPVIAAITGYYEGHNANVHRGVHTLSDEATGMMDAARAKVAAFINAPKPETLIFTRNATEAINLVAHAWGRKFLKSGDEILLTEMEHHSNLVPWQMLAQEKGVKLRFIPVTGDGRLDLEAGKALLNERTKLVSFTAASNALGTLNPVEKILSLAKASGAATLVDASQWAPHRPMDVVKWGCDFAVFSAHKMLGPTGMGALYGKEALLDSMDPFLGGGDMIERVTLERSTYNVLPNKFEAGTPHIAGAVGFGAAIDYLNGVGLQNIRDHEVELTRRAIAVLSAEPEVTIYGPKDLGQRGGVVSFNIDGLHPHDVGTAFDLEGVAIRAGHHCCQPLMARLNLGGTARASFYLYNTLEEVEAMGRALRRTLQFFKKPTAVS